MASPEALRAAKALTDESLVLACMDGTDEQVGPVLGLAPQTLKNRRRELYRRLGVSGRYALFDAAFMLGLYEKKR